MSESRITGFSIVLGSLWDHYRDWLSRDLLSRALFTCLISLFIRLIVRYSLSCSDYTEGSRGEISIVGDVRWRVGRTGDQAYRGGGDRVRDLEIAPTIGIR